MQEKVQLLQTKLFLYFSLYLFLSQHQFICSSLGKQLMGLQSFGACHALLCVFFSCSQLFLKIKVHHWFEHMFLCIKM